MLLLDYNVRLRLPTIQGEHNPRTEDKMWVVARFTNTEKTAVFYLIEGGQSADGYALWGFVVAEKLGFGFPLRTKILLVDLEMGNWIGRTPAIADPDFKQEKWSTIRDELFPHKKSLHR